AYRFVAPEAPPAGITFTLRARATDGSANVSDPATISWTVKPNAPPQDVALTFTPASVYPANSVVSSVTFEDEGTFATVVVAVSATRLDGSAWASTQTKQITRATVADPWPPAQITFALPSDLNPTLNANFTATVTDVRGLSTPAAATLTLLADTGKPSILSVTPAAETTYHLNDKYTIVATVTDAETAVAEVDFAVDGHTYPVLASSPAVVAGPVPGSKLFPSPQITVPAKNIDTRISVVINARDYQGNTSSKAFELIYIGVNDPAIPKGSWLCPVDRSVIPAAQTNFVLPLRAKATDDIAVTSVKFRVPGIVDPINGTRVGTTDEYTATATLATTPAAGSDFVLTAIISDADTTHTIEVPIAVDIVAIDQTIDATQAITVDNVAQFDSKSILVRGATGRLVTHVPVTLQNLIVLDGARVESLGTTTAIEYKVDVTVVDRLYVDCASSIDVTSKGYLGGWGTSPDGSGTRNDSAIGRTAGNTTTGGPANSGGSHGGLGSSGDGGVTNNAYDPIGDPAQLGTGGSGNGSVPGFCCVPGGSGGGAVSIRTSSATDAIGRVVIAGEIRADGGGGGGFFRGGSGGSIRINARQVIVSGSALVSTNGGDVPSDGTGNAGPSGAGGRVAVTASERLDIPDILTQFESRGGTTPSFSRYLGAGSGTIFVRRPGQNYGELYVATATAPRPVRATPLSGDLTFDRVHIGGYALGRFDESVTIGTHVDDRSTMTGESTAIVLLASDHPALSATAAPASGSDLIRASNVVVTWTASSIAGLANATTLLSAAPPARVDLFPAYPPTLTAQTTTIAVPATAPLGPATLTLRLTDRADRFTDAPVVTYIVVDNQPPAISAFTLNPESVYPGHSVTATVNASDDLAVTKLTLTTQIGASAPIVDARTPNAKTTEQTFTIPIPITTPGLTPVSVEAAVEDNFPGRAALKQTRSISVLKDTLPPQLTLTRPALDELFDEGTGKFVEYRAAASDAEVDVKSVTVTVGDAAPVPLTKDATGWTVTLPVANVDGTDIVTVPFTMTASDYESNTKTLPSRIRVRPLIDPNAPA
ncbi:MAG: hypothetical protein ACXW19_10580, partial [Thermoanaerobaculia bacterium]